MGEYHIKGGRKLSGELKIHGGKNAILPILAATVLNAGESVIHNCPKISDTFISMEILEAIGCKVKMQDDTLVVDSSTINKVFVPEHLVRQMRSSIIFMGGLLGRFGNVKISHPGGCALGARPIDLHLAGLGKLGAVINDEHDFISAHADELVGTRICLDLPSVGATENIMLAATLAKGETIISNAAREPEIVDLEKFLNGMGADIHGAGSDTIVINGVESLHRVTHSVMPDRIVAGTYLVAAAITKGSCVLTDVDPEHLYPITAKLAETGCIINTERDKIRLTSTGIINPIDRLITNPHPGFPTDMQAQFTSLLTLADGISIVTETVFDARFRYASELARMGANIWISGDSRMAFIQGVPSLKGASGEATDLRGGAALILAGLAAEGETIVTQSQHVERGYQCIEHDLRALGADIYFKK